MTKLENFQSRLFLWKVLWEVVKILDGLGHIFRSEIHAVMTGGFATIAGTVLAAFINFGIKADLLIGNAQ